uniref:Glutathione S-transferase kappa n=1 Tax=Ornithodoros turicata TaxID=34597 RepID=A0A2R5L466_9ACAR
MALTKTTVELFYDVISPYSYIAFETLLRYEKPWNLNLMLRPFFLGGVMKAAGNRPPGMVPNKAIYMFKDLARLSQYYKIPLKPPPFLMEFIMTKSTVKPQRFLTALDMKLPEYLVPASRGFWKRLYEEHKDIAEDDSVSAVGATAGLNEQQLKEAMAMMGDDKVKNTLKERTDEAVEKYGAFGAPTIVVHTGSEPEVFFGSDRFEVMASVLGKQWNGPLPHGKL